MDKKRKKGKEKVNIVKLINNIIESKIATRVCQEKCVSNLNITKK